MPGGGLDIQDGILVPSENGQVAEELTLNDTEAASNMQTFVAPELWHWLLVALNKAGKVLLGLTHLLHQAYDPSTGN